MISVSSGTLERRNRSQICPARLHWRKENRPSRHASSASITQFGASQGDGDDIWNYGLDIAKL